jgi:predicted exporter
MSTERNRIWQGSFLVGICICMLAAIVAFGLSALSGMISVGTLVIGVLNGLFIARMQVTRALVGSSRG